MSKEREQKLIDLCFEFAIHSAKYWRQYSDVEIATMVSSDLEYLGFPTVPMGSSWGVLKTPSKFNVGDRVIRKNNDWDNWSGVVFNHHIKGLSVINCCGEVYSFLGGDEDLFENISEIEEYNKKLLKALREYHSS